MTEAKVYNSQSGSLESSQLILSQCLNPGLYVTCFQFQKKEIVNDSYVDSNHFCWGNGKCDPALNKEKYGFDGGDCKNPKGLGCHDLDCCDDIVKYHGIYNGLNQK